MEVTLGAPFGYEPNDGLRKLLEDFRDILQHQKEDSEALQAQA